jgi:hypothetical protein
MDAIGAVVPISYHRKERESDLWHMNKAVVCPKDEKKDGSSSVAVIHQGGSAITVRDQGTCDDGHNTRREKKR